MPAKNGAFDGLSNSKVNLTPDEYNNELRGKSIRYDRRTKLAKTHPCLHFKRFTEGVNIGITDFVGTHYKNIRSLVLTLWLFQYAIK